MLKLAAIVYIMIGTTLAGVFVVAALSMGRMEAMTIAMAALAGAIVALPVAWGVAAKLDRAIRPTQAS
ncbi:hypothetical protein [Hoeflea olei]|uniref:CTP synthetase n=1 Tax=Hoeflea olei TaxID=1480615 RepID=A0A1C1YUH1_9HYPH|nr:hypothetical protein [Hoeflea olei]OCW57213.1 hypothetical protein AWJ14_11535 [Hoeflea olei]